LLGNGRIPWFDERHEITQEDKKASSADGTREATAEDEPDGCVEASEHTNPESNLRLKHHNNIVLVMQLATWIASDVY